jgi:Mg2+ and Co2+ transporter CorA
VTGGELQEDELGDFLKRTNRFEGSAPKTTTGGIRMVVCDYLPGIQIDFELSKVGYNRLAESFQLHPATLSTLQYFCGSFCRFVTYNKDSPTEIESISIILNVPRHWEIAIYGLSLTYDVATKTTSALFAGEDACMKWNNSRLEGFQDFVEEHRSLWNNPLLLPCALISDHWIRVQPVWSGLTWNMQAIEQELGVAKVSRPDENHVSFYSSEEADFDPFASQLPRAKVKDLTVTINTQFSKILYCKRSPQWHTRACQFFIKLQDELHELIPTPISHHAPIRQHLEHHDQLAQSLEYHVTILQSRVDVQLNILYSIVAQTDNQLNARLAASAGRDSTSMKILALITVIFLPGTFVATLFSMSMFNWSTDGSSAAIGRVLSPKFFWYWVTTIPLTLFTLFILGLWWRYEKFRFDNQIALALDGAEFVPQRSSRTNSGRNLLSNSKSVLPV